MEIDDLAKVFQGIEVVDLPDTTGWHALVEDQDGNVVYDGPAPVPDDLLPEGEQFHFVMTPPEKL